MCTASAADITRRIWAYCNWGGNWQSTNNSIRIHYFKSDGSDITSWDASASQYMTRFNSTNWFFYDITADENDLTSVKVIIRANSGEEQTVNYDNSDENMNLVTNCYKLIVEYANGANRATVSELKYYLLNASTSARSEMTTTDCCTFIAPIDNQTSTGNNSYVVAPSFAFSDDFSETYWGLVFRPYAEYQNLAFENASDKSFFAADNNSNAWKTNNVPAHFELSLHTLSWNYDVSAYIERTLPLAAEGYATFSSTYDVIPQGLTAQYASGVNTTTKKITWENFESAGIKAGEGALLKGTAGTTYKFTPATTNPVDHDSGNLMKAITTNTTLTGSDKYILSKVNDLVAFYKVNSNGGSKVNAGTAYLQVSSAAARDFFTLDNDATAIEAVKQESEINGECYNLAGQRISQPTKGLYIVNGKKVVIK